MCLIRCISPTYTVYTKTEEVNRPGVGQLSCIGVRKIVRDRMFPAHIRAFENMDMENFPIPYC